MGLPLDPQRFDVILFDLGGVIVELTGVPCMMEWLGHRITEEALWQQWLTSHSVRKFERGHIRADQFATSIVAEFQLPVSASDFLQEFSAWPKGVYPGATDLLKTLAKKYRLACLSNTNEIHWPRICDEMGLFPYFSDQFPSHQLGLIKPDLAVFEHVLAKLSCSPERMLFLDDNQLCVDGARKTGMEAYRVVGLNEASLKLIELGILGPFGN